MTISADRCASPSQLATKQYLELVSGQTMGQSVGGEQIVVDDASALAVPPADQNGLWAEVNRLHGIENPPEPPTPDAVAADAPAFNLGTGPIVFNHGVPVGGWANLNLTPGGGFVYNGHFHVSGAPSYNVSCVYAIRTRSGKVFTFVDQGRVHGTFESGSRNHDWNRGGNNAALAAVWGELQQGFSWRWSANANIAIGPILDSLVSALGGALQVIAILV